MSPLTGPRLREALFKPETFSLMTQDWGDQSIYEMFSPPGRSSNTPGSGTAGGGNGGVQHVFGPGAKFAMIEELSSNITEADLQELGEKLSGDTSLLAVAKQNQSFMGALKKLSSIEYGTVPRHAPDVVQMGYSAPLQKYWVKTASRIEGQLPQKEYLSRREMIQKVGEEATGQVSLKGTLTLSENASASSLRKDREDWEDIESNGIYKVRTTDGRTLVGWVLTPLVDLDGLSVPMSVFTNGSEAAIQRSVGRHAG